MSGQAWQVNTLGGYLANPSLSRQVRQAASTMMRFRQFLRPEPGFGRKKGESILFDKISKVVTAGNKLVETQRIPETNITITQGTLTVYEWGNSVPYTGKLEDLAEYSVDNIWSVALRDDMAEVLDAASADAFQLCKIKATPTGTAGAPTITFDTDGTISNAATRNVQTFDIEEIVLYLKSTLKARKYDGENYVCVHAPAFTTAIRNSSDWRNAAQYGDPERLFKGEIGRYCGVRFVEESNTLSDALGTTSYRAEAIFFGADPAIEGVAIPGEMRSKIPEDYGRSKGVAWYALLGFQITWDTANPREANVVHVHST